MDDNPYAPPRQPSNLPDPRPQVCVDGRYLVVRDGAFLPARCVFTNEDVTRRDRRTRRFNFAPSFRVAIGRHRCRISYCMSRKQRLTLYRNRTLVFIVAASLGWLFFSPRLLAFLSAALITATTFRNQLSVKKAKDGQFWIDGCGDAFLAACRNEFGIY